MRRARTSVATAPVPVGVVSSAILVAVALVSVSGCEGRLARRALDLPARAPDAPTGTRLARELAGLDLDAREERVYQEFAAGNLPTWQRELRPLRMTRRVGERAHEIVVWVAPDYLTLGSDDDHLLVPVSPGTAQRIADLVEASVPTPVLVDEIWLAADARLAPQRLAPQDSIGSVRSVDYFERHTSVIQGQRMLRGVGLDDLVAGHKKDVVLSPVLESDPGKVAVYGMHRPDGTPTQSLSTVAPAEWVYYNHGIRLVHRRVLVDGADLDLRAILRDSTLAPLLSERGAMREPWYAPHGAVDGDTTDPSSDAGTPSATPSGGG